MVLTWKGDVPTRVKASEPHSSPYLSRLERLIKLEKEPDDLIRPGREEEPLGGEGCGAKVTDAVSDFVEREGEVDVMAVRVYRYL